jgi:hypothetical protein
MAARVGGYPGGYGHHQYLNTDPGVYEPECDFYGEEPPEPTGYPDTEEFLQQYASRMTEAEPVQAAEEPPVEEPQVLPLAGDYAGLGGPKTVPLYTPAAFEQPAKPVERNILDEIFLEPTDDQLRAYNRVILKGKVVQNKERLKWSIFIHYILLFLMLTKLTPEVLDKFDVFVLEVEELFVPKPLIWEWLWLLSAPVTFFGLSACKHSSLKSIKQFLIGSLSCSLLPVLLGMALHAVDCYQVITEGVTENIMVWQGYPYAMLWYAFFFVSLQVHLYQIYFANCLMQAWLPAGKKTQ